MGWWLKLDTDLKNHWLWNKKPFSKGQAWIDLLLLAEIKNHPYLWRGNLKQYKKGSVYRSMKFLANRWGWDRRTVKCFLNALEQDNMVSLECTRDSTTITIVNYGKYQGNSTSDCTSECTSNSTSKSTSKCTYNKNNKSNKNIRIESSHDSKDDDDVPEGFIWNPMTREWMMSDEQLKAENEKARLEGW